MSKEGSLGAPIRHPIDFEHPDFLNPDKLVKTALLFISGGAIGNAIDRVYFGGVIDFIDIFLYTFHWPAFNFADIYITFGVVILLFESFYRNFYIFFNWGFNTYD